jgi:prepilin-type N-terminal cleavage/methylation domain-containing protein
MIGRLSNGYTLIELLVAIAIIIIMTSIVVGSYSIGKHFDLMKSNTDRVASTLRSIRGRAFSGVGYNPGLICDDGAYTERCNNNGECAGNCVGYQVCSLDTATFCADNSNCISAKGHCSTSFYPNPTGSHGGYGVYLVDTGSYLTFADAYNVAGVGNYYEGGDELIENFDLPNDFVFEFRDLSDVTEIEILFHNSTVEVYEKNVTWSGPITGVNTYTIEVEHANGCGETEGQHGVINIDLNTSKIYEEIVDC